MEIDIISYQAVENMRNGMSPNDAAIHAIARIVKKYPSFKGAIVTLNKKGMTDWWVEELIKAQENMEEQHGIGYSSTVFEILPCNQLRWLQFTLLMSPFLYEKVTFLTTKYTLFQQKGPTYHSRLPEKSVDSTDQSEYLFCFCCFWLLATAATFVKPYFCHNHISAY